MRRTGASKICVWRWQKRSAAARVERFPRDKTRPSRVPPSGQDVINRVVAVTATEPPQEATHWTAAAMAKAIGISVSSVQRIWKAHGLAPHRLQQFKLSPDPDFVPKLRAVVGLSVDPPAHAVVLSVDDKSQIQVLDRSQPSLPTKPGRAGTTTHNYKRHGTTIQGELFYTWCSRGWLGRHEAASQFFDTWSAYLLWRRFKECPFDIIGNVKFVKEPICCTRHTIDW